MHIFFWYSSMSYYYIKYQILLILFICVSIGPFWSFCLKLSFWRFRTQLHQLWMKPPCSSREWGRYANDPISNLSVSSGAGMCWGYQVQLLPSGTSERTENFVSNDLNESGGRITISFRRTEKTHRIEDFCFKASHFWLFPDEGNIPRLLEYLRSGWTKAGGRKLASVIETVRGRWRRWKWPKKRQRRRWRRQR